MRENSRQAILDHALALFAQYGYEAVSPGEIVEAAGITKPTMYYFFGSKRGLLDALLAEEYAAFSEILQAACVYTPNSREYDKDVYPVLIGLVQACFGFAKRNTDFYMLSLHLGFAPPDSEAAIASEHYIWEQYTQLAQLFTDISAVHHNLRGRERLCGWQLMALVNAQVAFWRRGYGELDDNAARAIVTGFMHGIFS